MREKNSRKRSNSFSVEQLFEGNPIRFDFIQKHHRICKEILRYFYFYGDEIVFPSMNRNIFFSFLSQPESKALLCFALPFIVPSRTIYCFLDAQVSPSFATHFPCFSLFLELENCDPIKDAFSFGDIRAE